MASIVAGAVINAVAFTGASFLFHVLGDRGGALAEQERHNEAIEELQRAKEKWYENEVARKDKIQKLRMELSDANHDINATNYALDRLK